MKNLHAIVLLLLSSMAYSQTPAEREWIQSHYDLPALKQFADSVQIAKKENYDYALVQAQVYNWPEFYTDAYGNYSRLVGVQNDTIPVYFSDHNINAAASTRTNLLHTGGGLGLDLNGEDMYMAFWEVTVARISHQEFGGRLTYGATDASINGSAHGTHVAGTLFAEGIDPLAKGMAPLATGKSYDVGMDQFEMITEAYYGLLVSNHSYGQNPAYYADWSWGQYATLAREWDKICYNAPYYLPVGSAGNWGLQNLNSLPMPGAGTTYDKLLGYQTGKNPLIVAAADDATVDANGNLVSVSIAGFSSPGPTDDLRIKPDITGNGVDVYSSGAASDSYYYSNNGTSMAAPNVAGSLLLLQQHSRNVNNGEFMRAATLKGLTLHTADDILTAGPDAISGWGLLNAKRAAETMTVNGSYSLITENTLENTQTYTFDVLSDGVHPLSASLSWTDVEGAEVGPPFNNPAAVLVNNLNLRVIKGPDDFHPYHLTSPTSFSNSGQNNVDPYEKIDIGSASGVYTIEVSHSGNLTTPYSETTYQDYSLIITGIIVCTASDNDIFVTEDVPANENDVAHSIQNVFASNTVTATADAYYRGGNSVTLDEGFYAEAGSVVLAEIGDCGIIGSQSFSGSRSARPQDSEDADAAPAGTEGLMLYPNPASGYVVLKNSINMAQVTVIATDGKTVISKPVNAGEYTLDISTLNTGLYLVNVETVTGETITKKLAVN